MSTQPVIGGDVTAAAINQSARNNANFVEFGVGVVKTLATKIPTITTDQVWDAISKTENQVFPNNNGAMGPVMLEAAKRGYITRTDATQASTRKQAHRRLLRVFKSNVFVAN